MPTRKIDGENRWMSPRLRAVTLIELLVAISVVAILAAITLTGLRGVRKKGNEIQQLSDLRSAGQLLLTWSSENQDAFFNVGLPPRPEISATVYLESPTGELIQVDYLGQWYAWPRLLLHWTGERTVNGAGIFYALGCITDPSLWTDDPPPWTTYPAIGKWRIVRVSETSYPSQKAMMFRPLDGSLPIPEHPTYPFFFVDGSAEVVDATNIVPPTEGFYGGGPADPRVPGRDTLHGVRGRDAAR